LLRHRSILTLIKSTRNPASDPGRYWLDSAGGSAWLPRLWRRHRAALVDERRAHPGLAGRKAGLVIAIVAGCILGRPKLERWVEPFVFETRLGGQIIDPSVGLTWDDRIQMGSRRSAGSCARSGSLLMDRWVGHDRPLPHPASSEADNARLRDPRLDCPNLQRRNRTGTNRGVRAA